MANNNYIGVNGIVTQSLNDIKSDLTTKLQSIYGTDININSNSPDGQFINLLSQEKKDSLDLAVQFYNNLDVDRAVGISQQILYKLNNCTIKAYTYSYVYINVSVTNPVNITGLDADINNTQGTGYTVYDNNGNRWILAESQSLTIGTHTLNFRAAELGSVTATPNTIVNMETIIAGISGVTNPANNYITGVTGESESEFRLRRAQSVSSPSQGFEDSIEAQLLALDNVTQAKCYSNRESTTINSIPANTVWVIAEGGTSDEVGRVIYNNIPPGIPMKGTQTVQVLRPNGSYATIKYDIGAAVNLYISMDIQLLSGAIDEAYIKEQLSLITFNIGESAEGVNIAAAAKEIVSTSGSPYNVLVSIDGITYSEIASPTALNEYFTISASNITINVVGA